MPVVRLRRFPCDICGPYHNAGDVAKGEHYYLVNGSWQGSWRVLSKDVIVFKWGSNRPVRESAKWFANRGHRQALSGLTADKRLALTEGLSNIVGYSYTVWNSDYSGMKELLRQLRDRKDGASGTGAKTPADEAWNRSSARQRRSFG